MSDIDQIGDTVAKKQKVCPNDDEAEEPTAEVNKSTDEAGEQEPTENKLDDTPEGPDDKSDGSTAVPLDQAAQPSAVVPPPSPTSS